MQEDPEVPSAEQIDRVVEFLTQSSCGLKMSDMPKVTKAFPQVFGCDVDSQLQASLDVLENEWKFTGKVLTGVLKRRPQTLGCHVDCGGSCIGDCDRCWVRF